MFVSIVMIIQIRLIKNQKITRRNKNEQEKHPNISISANFLHCGFHIVHMDAIHLEHNYSQGISSILSPNISEAFDRAFYRSDKEVN